MDLSQRVEFRQWLLQFFGKFISVLEPFKKSYGIETYSIHTLLNKNHLYEEPMQEMYTKR